LLKHPKILATPHIGAATNEAQGRIGLEIAAKVKEIMNK
jgi:D-3-phosphoglycerate dehydrogenase